ncbi:MAG: HD domain-containing protein, partial [Flavobacteriales bacterium]
ELRLKGHHITEEEELGLLCAILLHDIGHGPFSHALEYSLAAEVHHEDISSLMIDQLDRELGGALHVARAIFDDRYPKRFLHQLVSSQLDMDRLDYLARDSFFSGVVEGQVGSERILKMLDVVNDELVVEEKGIYSIEKFIVARRFMYWQVYLHKTVLSAEFMLVNALRRAKFLARKGQALFCTPSLQFFLYGNITRSDLDSSPEVLQHYAMLDDFDIATSLKVWQSSDDAVLSELSRRLIVRDLFKIEIQRSPFAEEVLQSHVARVASSMGLSQEDASFMVLTQKVDNRAYNRQKDFIRILMKDGSVRDAADVSDHLNLAALSSVVEKHFIAYPK